MSSINFAHEPSNDTDSDTTSDDDTITDTDPTTSSTANRGTNPRLKRVSFNLDPALAKASTVSPGTPDMLETPPGNTPDTNDANMHDGTTTTSNTHAFIGTMPNIPSLKSFPSEGPLAKACLHLSTGGNLLVTTHGAMEDFNLIFDPDANTTIEERTKRIEEQLTPFPFLAVSHEDNTVVVLHGFKHLIPPVECITNVLAKCWLS